MNPGSVFSVNQLNTLIQEVLEGLPVFADVWVRGEISNYKQHTSGHIYFTLKDNLSTLRSVMFRSDANRLVFSPNNGMNVLARGRIGLYHQGGQYQLYVRELQPDGIGSLYLALEQLKERLAAEGLFAADRKRTIPVLPRKIGIVTSPVGAALRDIVSVARRRCPQVGLVLAPAAVQGAEAPRQLIRALQLLETYGDVDVIIVGRGGGSLEELWAFNDEGVIRAIAAATVPVVTAVGHETDVTLVDLVADRRAPTPSAAAEMVVPLGEDLKLRVEQLAYRLQAALQQRLRSGKDRLLGLAGRPALVNSEYLLASRSQQLDYWEQRLAAWASGCLRQRQLELGGMAARLDALSPLAVLSRGYAICRQQDGSVVRDAAQVQPGGTVSVLLHRGLLDCQVTGIKEVGNGDRDEDHS